MTCEELLQALNQYIDDGAELFPLCEEFAEHLAGCNPCQVVVDNIRKTITLYKAGEPYPMPAEFQDRLRSALQKKWQEKFGSQ
jgi:hypothetical protein